MAAAVLGGNWASRPCLAGSAANGGWADRANDWPGLTLAENGKAERFLALGLAIVVPSYCSCVAALND